MSTGLGECVPNFGHKHPQAVGVSCDLSERGDIPSSPQKLRDSSFSRGQPSKMPEKHQKNKIETVFLEGKRSAPEANLDIFACPICPQKEKNNKFYFYADIVYVSNGSRQGGNVEFSDLIF